MTANKKLIADHGIELDKLARSQRLPPVLWRGGRRRHPGDSRVCSKGWPVTAITRIEGILNGTCNFILSKMEDGRGVRSRC